MNTKTDRSLSRKNYICLSDNADTIIKIKKGLQISDDLQPFFLQGRVSDDISETVGNKIIDKRTDPFLYSCVEQVVILSIGKDRLRRDTDHGSVCPDDLS